MGSSDIVEDRDLVVGVVRWGCSKGKREKVEDRNLVVGIVIWGCSRGKRDKVVSGLVGYSGR